MLTASFPLVLILLRNGFLNPLAVFVLFLQDPDKVPYHFRRVLVCLLARCSGASHHYGDGLGYLSTWE
jgi:hypothetical protein